MDRNEGASFTPEAVMSRQLHRLTDAAVPLVLQTVLGAALWLARPIHLTTDLVVRRCFGERYINPLHGLAVLGLVATVGYSDGFFCRGRAFSWVAAVVDPLWALIAVGLAWIFVLATALVLHVMDVRDRYRTGRIVHTRYFGKFVGIAIGPLTVDVPPERHPDKVEHDNAGGAAAALCLVFGAVCFVFGLYHMLGLAAVSAVLAEAARRAAAELFRQRMLDVIDARVEAENLGAAVMGRYPVAPEGVTAAVPAVASTAYRHRFLQAAQGTEFTDEGKAIRPQMVTARPAAGYYRRAEARPPEQSLVPSSDSARN
jgi:hypothetical protein